MNGGLLNDQEAHYVPCFHGSAEYLRLYLSCFSPRQETPSRRVFLKSEFNKARVNARRTLARLYLLHAIRARNSTLITFHTFRRDFLESAERIERTSAGMGSRIESDLWGIIDLSCLPSYYPRDKEGA